MITNCEIEFSIKFLKLFNSDTNDKAVAFSPTSILNNLALICAAASDGIYADRIAKIISEDASRDALIQHYKNLNIFCKTLQEKDDNGIGHLISKNLIISDESLVSSDTAIMKQFNTDYLQMNFGDNFVTKINEAVSQYTSNQMNCIVAEEEKDMIKKIEAAKKFFIIVNSVYITPEWDNHFTTIGTTSFFLNSSSNSIRSTQCIYKNIKNERWNLNEGETWKCLGIPYKGRKSWIHILLPNAAENLNKLINEFDITFLKKCIAKNDAGEITVQIPIFQIESNISLNEILHNFGNICDIPSTQGMFNHIPSVDKVLHGTNINVSQPGLKPNRYDFRFPQNKLEKEEKETVEEELNEEEADEAFLKAEENIGKIKTFYANRPFIFFTTLVNDSVDNLQCILAMGKYTMS